MAMMMSVAEARIREAAVVCWDFDGVVKESVAVKTDAYVQLFAEHGPAVAARVRAHHERHGGMSRFEKIPLYLEWAGLPRSDEDVARYCARFADLVLDAVVAAPWIAGVEAYLRTNPAAQRFYLVTGTPQDEAETILERLDLRASFAGIYGAPTPKAAALAEILEVTGCPLEKAIMIGDAHSDHDAAAATGMPFALRKTELNADLQSTYEGLMFRDLING